MMGRVPVSKAFAVTNGVKQGCVLAPTVFSLMFSTMLMEAYRDEQPEICIAYRTVEHLSNCRRIQAPARVSATTFHDLLFEDDNAFDTMTDEDMQRSMNLFVASCANFLINSQCSQNGGHAQTATQCEIQCAPKQCQWCSTQKYGNLSFSEKHTVTQHENRRRGC
ncbi:unnamed protein product [Schistocephalus solidus]|uniref:Reverse transcriptase domain-containing protein n=1 Tax=Schistocephalus solidus TaxID=70667 RepID=A0A183STM2_SCHSO|nr:unnamed protein product [Schistocephalus solidus]